MTRHLRLYALLLFLPFAAVVFRFAFTTTTFLFNARTIPQPFFDLSSKLELQQSLPDPLPNYPKAQKGDTVLSIQNIPLTSRAQVTRILFPLKVGTPVQGQLRRPDGSTYTTVIALPPFSSSDIPVPIYLLFFVLNLFQPIFSILLGLFVVWRRPRDPLAWTLSCLLYLVSQIATANGGWRLSWSEPWAILAFALGPLCFLLWPVAFFWFSLLFPDPHSPRLLSFIRYPLTVTATILALLLSLDAIQSNFYPHAFQWLDRLPAVPSSLIQAFAYLPVIAAFLNLAYKRRTETQRDCRRRIRLLVIGLAFGLTPYGLLNFVSSIQNKAIPQLAPVYIWIPSLIALALVPATMAYVIVVERAMDVGVVLRQGLQYAFARRTVDALRLILAVVFTVLLLTYGANAQLDLARRALMIAAFLAALFFLDPLLALLRRWLDKRFFREAIDTEHIFSSLATELRSITQPAALLSTVATRIQATMHIPQVLPFLRDQQHFASNGFSLAASSPLAQRLGQGPAHIYFDRPEPWLTALPSSDTALLQDTKAELLLPIASSDQLHGFLALSPKRSEEPYSPTDLRLLESLASQTALALENSRLTEAVAQEAAQRERLHREVEIAREVQLRLLPKKQPLIEGLDYSGACRPAQLIGGDYYDYIATPSGHTAFAIGDISGKGIPAALLMSNLQASLRGLTLAGITDLRDLLAKLNQLVYDSTTANRFATFFYVLYHPPTRQVIYSSAGHNPAALLRAGADRVEWLRTKGIALGLKRIAAFEQAEFTLAPGDILVLYTDGLTEAVNPARDEYGEDRLAQTLLTLRHQSALHIQQGLIAAVDAFAAAAPQHDDMTLLVLRASPGE